MRPSPTRWSEMPGPKEAYGKWWGDSHSSVKMKGVIQYTLSPYQSKVMPNYASKMFFNGYRRISGEVLYFMIPFAIGYGIYTWGKGYNEFLNSKAGHLAMEESHHEE